MKRIRICIAAIAAILISVFSFTVSADAALTINESYMFVLGENTPDDIESYGSPTLLTEQAVKEIYGDSVKLEEIAALLRAGSALDLLGYMDSYNIGEEKAHTLTQYALDILTGKTSHTQLIQNLTSNERKYLAAVLKAGYAKTPVPAGITIKGASTSLKQDVQGNYVSEVMSMESVMGGIINFTDLPDAVKVYTLSGDEAPYLLSGQSFYLKSDAPFSFGTLTVEHVYHVPEILVYYHENANYSPLVTAVIGPENTAKDLLYVSLVPNPDTSDENTCVNALYFTVLLLQIFLCVQIHRRRKDLKISRICG